MTDLTKIKPINTKILFQFVEDLDNSQFHGKSKGGIYIVEHDHEQVKLPRWGKVLNVGRDVELVAKGEYILMEALGWTNGMTMTGNVHDDRFWFTDESKVMCVTDEAPTEF